MKKFDFFAPKWCIFSSTGPDFVRVRHFEEVLMYNPNNAYLIVEANDLSTAKWVIAGASWLALDKAHSLGFSLERGFAVVATIERVENLQNIRAICPDWHY